MKCEHWDEAHRNSHCKHFGPENCAGRDFDCDISGGTEMIPNPLLDALNEIKKYCANQPPEEILEFATPCKYLHEESNQVKQEIEEILKRYGL